MLLWAHDQLQSFSDRHASLNWDDRLGLLAISMCTEMAAIAGWVFVITIVLVSLGNLSLPLTCLLSVILGLLPCVAAGAVWRGGPVFRLTSTQVRCRNFSLAGPLRCACRSLVAWTPLVVGNLCLALMTVSVMDSNGNLRFEDAQSAILFSIFSMGWLTLVTLHFCGGLFAIFSPKRSLQDWLCGTRLLPS